MPPKRPRSHELEQESITAFRQKIPKNWVFRELDQDYGIDGEIEVFEEGVATGVKFLVQLKATDEKDLNKALSITFSKDTGEYYSSFDLPVLIIRYQAPTDKIFVRWFHTFDPYNAKKDSKYFTFKFENFHEWSKDTPNQIEEEIRSFRELRSPYIQTPVKFQLIVHDDALEGNDVYKVVSKIREEAKKQKHIVQIIGSGSPEKALNTINFSKDKIAVTLAGMNGFTLHTPEGYPSEKIFETLHFDILIAVALSLHWHGHSSIGARIISEVAKDSHLKSDLRLVAEMSVCLARANYFSQAMELSNIFFDDEKLINNAQILMNVILLGHRDKLTTSEREYAYSVLQKMAKRAEKLDAKLASAIQYNCGSLLISSKKYLKAIGRYHKAAKLEPDYYNRFYFWKELGGVFFESRRFKAASKSYECCLRLAPDNTNVQAFYADSLLFMGEYKKSLKEFHSYIKGKDVSPHDAEWQLKEYALGFIIEMLGLPKQNRDKFKAGKLFENLDMEDQGKLMEISKEALTHDALHSLAWYNIGIISSQNEDWKVASLGFLLAALTVPWDIEAWFNVIATAHHLDDHNLFSAALFVAYQYNGEEFIRYFQDKAVSEEQGDAQKLFNEISENLLSIANQSSPTMELRVHRPDGGFDLCMEVKE